MTKTRPPAKTPLPPHLSPDDPLDHEPHGDVSSPSVDHAIDRMKLASKPNDGQPLSHRDRGKAGRKG